MKMYAHLRLLSALLVLNFLLQDHAIAFISPGGATKFGIAKRSHAQNESFLLNSYTGGFGRTESRTARRMRLTNDALLRQAAELQAREVVSSFISSLSDNNGFMTIGKNLESGSKYPIFDFFHETIEFTDTSFYKPIIGKDALIRRLEQSPTSLFHINDTLPWMNVGYVTTGTSVDRNGDIDVKVAIFYQYWTSSSFDGGVDGVDSSNEVALESNVLIGEDSKKKYGITFYTVSDGLISQVFDVKEGGKLDSSTLRAEEVLDKGDIRGAFMDSSEAPENTVENAVTAFLEARNQRDYEGLRNMMWENCIAIGVMKDGPGRERESYVGSLAKLPDGVTFETEEIVASMSPHLPGTMEVAVRWVVAVEGQQQKYSRGCTFFTLENGRVAFVIDIQESVKQETFEAEARISSLRQNWLRDSGVARGLFDALLAASSPSILRDNDPKAIFTYAKLSREKVHLEYGNHSSQFVDLFLPQDPGKQRGLVFFVHGGAWGSGKPWMYRLAATPFLEANMAVAIVGYRSYPDGNMQDQIDDLELASRTIATRCPHLLKQPEGVNDEDWIGITLMGHSSGAHIALMTLVQRIERWVTSPDFSRIRDDDQALQFDHVVALSGVYSIGEHFDFEASRGVEEISPMRPAAGYTIDSFKLYSPATRLAKSSSLPMSQHSDILPNILLLHGVEDDVVPFTAANRAAKTLRGIGYDKLKVEFLNMGHQDTILHLMFGGQTKDVVMNWLQRRQEEEMYL